MYRVDDCFKQGKSLGGTSDTSADHNACIVCGSQVTFHCLPSSLIRTDEADIRLFVGAKRQVPACMGQARSHVSQAMRVRRHHQ